jgi:hypothetical protein
MGCYLRLLCVVVVLLLHAKQTSQKFSSTAIPAPQHGQALLETALSSISMVSPPDFVAN